MKNWIKNWASEAKKNYFGVPRHPAAREASFSQFLLSEPPFAADVLCIASFTFRVNVGAGFPAFANAHSSAPFSRSGTSGFQSLTQAKQGGRSTRQSKCSGTRKRLALKKHTESFRRFLSVRFFLTVLHSIFTRNSFSAHQSLLFRQFHGLGFFRSEHQKRTRTNGARQAPVLFRRLIL